MIVSKFEKFALITISGRWFILNNIGDKVWEESKVLINENHEYYNLSLFDGIFQLTDDNGNIVWKESIFSVRKTISLLTVFLNSIFTFFVFSLNPKRK